MSANSWTDDLAAVVRNALASTRAAAICRFHGTVMIRWAMLQRHMPIFAPEKSAKVMARRGSTTSSKTKLSANSKKRQMAFALIAQHYKEVEMYKHILGLTTSALILAYGTFGAIAQDRLTPQPEQQQMQSHPMDREGAVTMGHPAMTGGAMMEHMMRHGMMGGAAMGPPIMFRMVFALMDADGDGTISLQEFQAAHERIFKAMDSNKDGWLTFEEMEAFMHGTR